MELHYTNERNVQIVISLLKQYNIKRVVASPGTTNITFIGSIMHDPFFEIYSSVDERSAAYIACGIAEETGEPVVISCTGATASRNYFSGLTEAFYRKLPIVAITSTQNESFIGHLRAQVIDRNIQPKDIVKCSVHLRTIKDADDEWYCMLNANKALLELNHHGKGPVHINLETTYSTDFETKEIVNVRKINRFYASDAFPNLPQGRIAIYIGTHLPFTEEATKLIDDFCEINNSVVFCEPSSNYWGKYRVVYELPASQRVIDILKKPELLIHIGEVSDFPGTFYDTKQVWRVSEDGELRDRLKKLTCVFEMTDMEFFSHYQNGEKKESEYYQQCFNNYNEIYSQFPDLPLSNIWIASRLQGKLPKNSELHLGILNSLRAWSFFENKGGNTVFCNEGGFGIDGIISTAIGASLINKERLYFCILGDLAFFYDMNVLGNRHINNNLRILLVNNGKGSEFHLTGNPGAIFLPETELYMSAGGHYTNKSKDIVRHIATDWGFEYLSASTKEEFEAHIDHFLSDAHYDKPIIFEVFTHTEAEDSALTLVKNIKVSYATKVAGIVRKMVGNENFEKLKGLIR